MRKMMLLAVTVAQIFSLSFFKEVCRSSKPDVNVVASPYSAGVALSMLLEGAEGQTKVEIGNALSGRVFNDDKLDGGDSVVVRSANSVWIDDNFSVRNHYVSLLQKDYDALVETLSFADPATVHAINNWCSENTEGKIDGIIDELKPGDVMVLLNALYFNGPWENRFDKSLTEKAVFHGYSKQSDVDMMYRKGRYNYAEYCGCQIIELPYLDSRYSMFVALPPAGMDVNSVIPYVDGNIYKDVFGMMAPAEVKFRMPKARLETEMSLNGVLSAMGVKTAFTSAADFKGISLSGPLVLSEVKQKCYIDIAEGGTEAAAVTSVMVRLTSVRPEQDAYTMTVDRPYIFFIADRESAEILFAGKIVDL